MKFVLIIIFSLSSCFLYAQSTPGPDGRLMRDTNRVVYNEQGAIVKYSDYKNLLASGEYTVGFNGDPLLPGTRAILRKVGEREIQHRADVMDGIVLNTRILKLHTELDARPLAVALQKDIFRPKPILMVFSNPGCLSCGAMFKEINSGIEEFGPDSLVVLFITQNTEEKAEEALRLEPLTNARIVARATYIKEHYDITALPAFIIADRNRTIRYNGVGIGPTQALRVKNVLKELKGLVPEGYYSLEYDQKHMILSLKASKLMKEDKIHEAAEVYESLFIHSMGRGLQHDYYNAAAAWAKLDDSDKAFHYLNQAVFTTNYLSLTNLNNEPNFNKLRTDPRWKTITNQVGENLRTKMRGTKSN